MGSHCARKEYSLSHFDRLYDVGYLHHYRRRHSLKMDIRAALLRDRSKGQIEAIAHAAATDEVHWHTLVACMTESEPADELLTYRAAWALGIAGETVPLAWLSPYIPAFIQALMSAQHDGVKRNILRVFIYTSLPEVYWGELFDVCVSLALNPKEAVAIRAFSLKILGNIATQVPELWQEVNLISETMLQEPSPMPGIRSSIKQVQQLQTKKARK